MDSVRDDLREIQRDVKSLLANSAVHNTLLSTHEARSLALQRQMEILEVRLSPVERHVIFVEKFLKWAGGAAAGVTGIEVFKFVAAFFT